MVPVIVGATAVGKTAVALALAEHWSLTVVSADSRQVYRRLDIGTAKPTPEERSRVPHVGLDLVDPGERYSAGRYARDAAGWVTGIAEESQPVVVGGTGFYVSALVDGLFREPPMDQTRRHRLGVWANNVDGLGRIAARLDAGFSGGGRQRAARAVEVALLTGRPLSWWQRHARANGVMRPWYVLLRVPRHVLQERIERRVADMLRRGLVEETKSVLACGIAPGAPGLDAVGYREVVAHLRGELPLAAMASKIATNTRRYAKRQETWFRHQLAGHTVLTLDATKSPEAIARQIIEAWRKRPN